MIIGIDLGTTYSVAAYLDQNGNPQIIPNREGEDTTPSVVFFDADNGNIVVGSQAKEACVFAPYNVADLVKKYMGKPTYKFLTESEEIYKAEEISAIILKRIVEDCKNFLGEKINAAVITVPAYFGDAERKATMDAGKIAGINVLGLINEPTAAALAFGMSRKQSGTTMMVYDLGGGTFDVTILRIENNKFHVLATHGDKDLGGSHFDAKLVEYCNKYIKSKLGINPIDDDELQQELRIKCEKAKKSLSSCESSSFIVSVKGNRLKFDISRSDFEAMILPLINSTENSIDIALEEAGLTPKDIEKVLLVGGSTRVPAVRKFIQEKMHIVPSSEVHPDLAVAIGAAYYANELVLSEKIDNDDPHQKRKTELHDVNSHGLGIEAKNENGDMVNVVVLPRNTELPAKYQKIFKTSVDDQTQISLRVTEGDDTDLRYVTKIGETLLNIAPHPKESPICIDISLDTDGLIHVHVTDLVDNIVIGEVRIDRTANMTEADIMDKKQKIDQICVD